MVLLHGGSPKGAERIAAKWGRSPQGAADRLQAGLDQTRQGRAVQTQRRDARGAADRGHGVPRNGHSGQPRRQSKEARHPGLEVGEWRRVSAVSRIC